MKLAEQWREIEWQLPSDWAEARLALEVLDDAQRDRAAALLGPANPGRSGDTLRFAVARRGGGIGPDAAGRLLDRLDRESIAGSVQLVGSEATAEPAARERRTLLADWESELARLPGDWSDLYCEVGLDSSDYVDSAALLLAPLNPSRERGRIALRFRVARLSGYGAAPALVARLFARADAAAIRGSVRVLHVLYAPDRVHTLGPVLYVNGEVL